MTDMGCLARARRMALWRVGRPVDRARIARRAGIRPRERSVRTSVVTGPWYKRPRSYTSVTVPALSDPALDLLKAEEGLITLPPPAWSMVLLELDACARDAIESGIPWWELWPDWPQDTLRSWATRRPAADWAYPEPDDGSPEPTLDDLLAAVNS